MPIDKPATGLDPAFIHWFALVDSTMHEAARLAVAGAPSGTIVGADEQSAGQGRQGHSWHSETEVGLYVSFVLRIPVAIAEVPIVTLALGLAAAEAITKTAGVVCDLRWPNDVLIEGKKVCGILTQLHGTAVVAGIGINVNQPSFPERISGLATSLLLESGRKHRREELLGHLAAAVKVYSDVLVDDGKHALLRLFENASSYVRGRRVIVDDSVVGTTEGLNRDGFLVLRRDDGVQTLVLAGGVRPWTDQPGKRVGKGARSPIS